MYELNDTLGYVFDVVIFAAAACTRKSLRSLRWASERRMSVSRRSANSVRCRAEK